MAGAAEPAQVILLGADSPIGLTIIRELGGHGVAVHAIGASRRALGLYSRFVASRHRRVQGDDALTAQLEGIAGPLGGAWVLTVSENDLLVLERIRPKLRHARPIVPDAQAFATVLDKDRTFAVARSLDIRTPRTWTVGSLGELAGVAGELPFPLVLKWANPQRVTSRLAAAGLPFDKYRYVYDREALFAYLRPLEAMGELPLLQEYCGGVGLGQMLFMEDGRAVYRFQHRRVAEWPPEGGVSAVCESLPLDRHRALLEKSERLLAAIGWRGPAMVEYRWDAETGEACLMEVNGRFWGSLPLAWHAGAHFAWLSVQAASGSTTRYAQPYRSGLQCRYAVPELKRLVRIVLHPGRIQDRSARFGALRESARFLGRYFSPRTRYYVFTWRDPKPFFADLWFVLLKLLGR